MKHRSKLLLNGLIGVIVIAATLVIFFAGFNNAQKQTIDYLSLTFVLISEVALFGAMLALIGFNNSTNKVVLCSGILSALVIYWLVTIFVSIFFSPVFRDNTNGFVTTNIIIIAITAIVVIVLFMAAAGIKKKDESTFQAGLILQDCESMVFSMLNNKDCEKIASQLNSLYEELKFSDKSTCLPENEKEISLNIIELSNKVKAAPLDEAAAADAAGKINSIMLLVKERNRAVKQSKRGGY